MVERLLIANRGEIARRIIRTCRRLGVETVAVFSDADAAGAFVQDADLSVGLGGNAPGESYLRTEAIVAAALRTGADAIHPGYGFLAENADFARAVTDAGLTFVGPAPDVIAVMGSKLEAKARMADAGVPLLPSAELSGLADSDVVAAADGVGYPVLVKASAGGGGRGMRVVESPDELLEAVQGAAREAESAFGDGTVYAERYVSPSRHVEVQIFGDSSGRVVHFHERECSIQRRHQKIIEEAPSPSLDARTRQALHEAAVRAGEAIGYTNAGTVEFLLAPGGDSRPPEFFFLEVNTRLQVEHPVTEEILGFDLVELQLEVAGGSAVPQQSEIGPVEGHAIEARLYAEDPAADFRPSTGVVHAFTVPGPVRVESAIDSADTEAGEVSQFYDPMIAKVIAHAPTRQGAARRLASSLAATVVDGIVTNRDLLAATLRNVDFLGDRGDSEFFQRNPPAALAGSLIEPSDVRLHAAAAALALQARSRNDDTHTPHVASGFRNVVTTPQRRTLLLGDTTVDVAYAFRRGRLGSVRVDGVELIDPVLHAATADRVDLAVDGARRQFDTRVNADIVSATSTRASLAFTVMPRFVEPDEAVEPGSTVATMPGTIVSVAVREGDEVEAGDVLVVMEAMKMELAITASTAGTVTSVPVREGDTVEAGAVLAIVEPS